MGGSIGIHMLMLSGFYGKGAGRLQGEIKETMGYQLAIFDLDGTLLNTLEDLADSVNHALSVCGFPNRTIEEVRCFVGNGIRLLIERSVPGGTQKEQTDRVYTEFMEYYTIHCADKTRPYDGILELLCSLRKAGIKTAVVSNKADVAVKELCRKYFAGLLDEAIGERAGIRRKPAPDSIKEVLKKLGVQEKQAVYIGDSDVDVETADNAGLEEIAVTWGFRDRDFLLQSGAKVFVSVPKEIEEIVLT